MSALNPHLASMPVDYMMHLDLNSSMPLKEMFGHIKFVIWSGANGRAKAFAERLAEEFNVKDASLEPIGSTERYHLYKVGNVLSVSHGIGAPSISIILDEVTKVLHYAGATDFVYIRTGTCGGLGVPPGTLVLTTQTYTPLLEPQIETVVCGAPQVRIPEFNSTLRAALLAVSGDLSVVEGATVSCNDFYCAQGRMDGIFCDFQPEDRISFLRKCYDMGVRNLEMEGMMLGTFCGLVKIPCAMVCVTLIDRLQGDQVLQSLTAAQLREISRRPYDLVIAFVKSKFQ
eukprot:c35522_g1_i1.p1 GENE.c35522_g1_i1~~c35522_g1_i1.p1  ORF type:complete len:302 (+),score=65.03 c35522_g1_i1:49-906(+)